MKQVAKSVFKNPEKDLYYLKDWISRLEKLNGYSYENTKIKTSLGKTQVYGFNMENENMETIVIFPGFRTTSLIWDLDTGLKNLSRSFRIFMIETNGQPNLSEGNSPAIKSLDYGHWANEVFIALKIDKAFTIGASFGGLVCMKFAITNPEKIKASFILNAGCLQPFSLTFSNLYYNLLPVIFKSKKNVTQFLNKVIFSKPNHQISKQAEDLLNEYILFSLQTFKDKTQKPYYMGDELKNVKVDTYLLQGDKDILFPINKSIKNAKKLITNIKNVKIYNNVGHGIETYQNAIDDIEHTIKSICKSS